MDMTRSFNLKDPNRQNAKTGQTGQKGQKGMVYHWGPDYLSVTLSSEMPRRIRWLLIAELLFITGAASIILVQAWSIHIAFLNYLCMAGAALLYFMASYRFISRLYYKEQMLVDAEGITLVYRTPFRRQLAFCPWEEMGPVRYRGMEAKTDHPLKGNSFDYLGFETHENLTRFIHHEGNLHFTFQGKVVPFGRALYSWDAEDLMRMIKIYSGDRLPLGPEWSRMASMESGEATW